MTASPSHPGAKGHADSLCVSPPRLACFALKDGADNPALLHGAAEEQGGPATAAVLRQRFGDMIADIVDAGADTAAEPSRPRGRQWSWLQPLTSSTTFERS